MIRVVRPNVKGRVHPIVQYRNDLNQVGFRDPIVNDVHRRAHPVDPCASQMQTSKITWQSVRGLIPGPSDATAN
jgi:hypothetical protein